MANRNEFNEAINNEKKARSYTVDGVDSTCTLPTWRFEQLIIAEQKMHQLANVKATNDELRAYIAELEARLDDAHKQVAMLSIKNEDIPLLDCVKPKIKVCRVTRVEDIPDFGDATTIVKFAKRGGPKLK